MAKDFNIFLHRHLTECDLIIQSIPFRDGISVTDRMILNAYLQGCRLLRIAAVRSDMDIVAKIDKVIKVCHEKLGTSNVMDASADFKVREIMSLVNDPIEISAQNLGTLSTVLTRMETDMVMSVDPLVTRAATSLGYMDSQIKSYANVTNTLKRDLLTIRSSSIMGVDVSGSTKTGLLLDTNTKLSTNATLDSLCVRLGFDAVAGIALATMVLGTRLSHSLGRAIGGITINSKIAGTKAKKFEIANSIVQLMAEAVPVLIKLIYPDGISFAVDAGISGYVLKKYRLVDEMDNFTLDDFDDMTLDEVDYVVLAK